MADFGVIANTHANHILDVTVAPAAVAAARRARGARDRPRRCSKQLDVVGVLCVEFFLTRDGRLLINELAPRPHNSGHLTFDACVTSQFEQQLRAICGLPLGSTGAAAAGGDGQPAGRSCGGRASRTGPRPAAPQVKLHLYGKLDPRPGRKMGHLTALAETPDEAREWSWQRGPH